MRRFRLLFCLIVLTLCATLGGVWLFEVDNDNSAPVDTGVLTCVDSSLSDDSAEEIAFTYDDDVVFDNAEVALAGAYTLRLFNSVSGSSIASSTFDEGADISAFLTLNVPTAHYNRTDAMFAGWFGGSPLSAYTSTTMPAGSMDLYAGWVLLSTPSSMVYGSFTPYTLSYFDTGNLTNRALSASDYSIQYSRVISASETTPHEVTAFPAGNYNCGVAIYSGGVSVSSKLFAFSVDKLTITNNAFYFYDKPTTLIKVYGDSDPSLTYSLPTGLSGVYPSTCNMIVARQAGEDVGTYNLVSVTSDNPSINIVQPLTEARFTINRKSIQLTLDDLPEQAISLEYGTERTIAAMSVAFDTGLSAGYDSEITLVYSTNAATDVGTYDLTGVSCSNTNFNVTFADGVANDNDKFRIVPLNIIITKQAIPTFHAAYSGAVPVGRYPGTVSTGLSAPNKTEIDVVYTIDTTAIAAAGARVGDYDVIGVNLYGDDAEDINFNVSFDEDAGVKKFEIRPLPLTLYAADYVSSKAYDGTTSVTVRSAPRLRNVVEGDDVNLTYTIQYASAAARSPSTINITYTVTGADIDNYIAPSNEVNYLAVIVKRELRVTVSNLTINEGETPEFVVDITGFVEGESIDDLTTVPYVEAAEYAAGVYSDIKASGGVADNYRFTYQSATLTVNRTSMTASSGFGYISGVIPQDVQAFLVANNTKAQLSTLNNEYLMGSMTRFDLERLITPRRIAAAYSISVTRNSISIPLQSPVVLHMLIPEELRGEEIQIFFYTEDGEVNYIDNYEVSEDGAYAVFTITETGTYGIMSRDFTPIIVLVGAILLIIGIIVGIILLVRHRKKAIAELREKSKNSSAARAAAAAPSAAKPTRRAAKSSGGLNADDEFDLDELLQMTADEDAPKSATQSRGRTPIKAPNFDDEFDFEFDEDGNIIVREEVDETAEIAPDESASDEGVDSESDAAPTESTDDELGVADELADELGVADELADEFDVGDELTAEAVPTDSDELSVDEFDIPEEVTADVSSELSDDEFDIPVEATEADETGVDAEGVESSAEADETQADEGEKATDTEESGEVESDSAVAVPAAIAVPTIPEKQLDDVPFDEEESVAVAKHTRGERRANRKLLKEIMAQAEKEEIEKHREIAQSEKETFKQLKQEMKLTGYELREKKKVVKQLESVLPDQIEIAAIAPINLGDLEETATTEQESTGVVAEVDEGVVQEVTQAEVEKSESEDSVITDTATDDLAETAVSLEVPEVDSEAKAAQVVEPEVATTELNADDELLSLFVTEDATVAETLDAQPKAATENAIDEVATDTAEKVEGESPAEATAEAAEENPYPWRTASEHDLAVNKVIYPSTETMRRYGGKAVMLTIGEESLSFKFAMYDSKGNNLFMSKEYSFKSSCKKAAQQFLNETKAEDMKVCSDRCNGYRFVIGSGNNQIRGLSFETERAAENNKRSVLRICENNDDVIIP